MSSTNKTSHYNLPQFIGSDIPTWLGDFNSAMTAIDSGINAAATSASEAATTAAQALTDAAAAASTATSAYNAANRCPFPIGYGGFFRTDPNTIYAGTTWQQKKDVFILASGDTYGAGSTGGEAQHTLTEAEMPEHSHTFVRQQWHANDKLHSEFEGSIFSWKGGDGTGGNTSASYEGDTEVTGGNQPHNNMPPYYSMPFWVRTA